MTDDDAKKILDFLFKRVERNDYAIDISKITNIHVGHLNRLVVEYETWILSSLLEDNAEPDIINEHSYILATDNFKLDTSEYVCLYYKSAMMKDIVECLFRYAKSKDIIIGRMNTVLLHKGESLEEIKVKMDLEDFDEEE